ncbi:MAG: Threonine synthase, partial [uncultured Sphingomonadaceae bacterium]
ALRQHPGPRARAVLRGGDARGARVGRWAVRAGGLAAAGARGDRRVRWADLRGNGGAGDGAVRRRRSRARRAAGPLPRRLRPVPPRGRGAARPARRAPLAARAVPRPDARLQGRGDAATRAAVRAVLRGERAAADGDRRDERRHGIGGDRRARGAGGHRAVHAPSRRPRVGRAAAADDDRARAQRPQRRGRGQLRRRAGAGEGAVRRRGIRLAIPPVGGEQHQLGAVDGAGRLLFLRRRPARRAGPARGLFRADGQFRRRLRRLRCSADGAAGGEADRRHQRQRHRAPGAQRGRLFGGRGAGDGRAVHGHSGVLQLRTAPVRPPRPRRRGGGAGDGGVRGRTPHAAGRHAAGDRRSLVRFRRSRAGRDGVDHALGLRGGGAADRPAYRHRARRGPRAGEKYRAGRHHRHARHRAPGQVPRRGGARNGDAAGLAPADGGAVRARGALREAAGGAGGGAGVDRGAGGV